MTANQDSGDKFDYRDIDEGEQIEDRLMVPLDALELAVQGGCKWPSSSAI